jgi:HAD superfamily hydrolase (TIGR01509 family)
MQPLRGVILDLDGTIADSIDFFYGLTCEVLAEAGLPLPARVDVLDAIARGLTPPSRFLPDDFPDREAFVERVYRSRWPEWVARYGREVAPLPGACEAVESLHRQGLRIALVTSSMGAAALLERWGIRPLFDVVVGREDVSAIKPDPEPILSGLSRLGLSSAEALGVGDSPLDARAGRAAGIDTVGVLTGAGTEAQLRAEGVSAILASLAELPDFLGPSVSGKNGDGGR